MSRKNLSNRLVWVGAATIVAAAMLVPAALADKPASKSKPIAAEKTWVKVGGGKGYGTYLTLAQSFKDLLMDPNVAIAAAPLKPAGVTGDGIRFPITQGKLVLGKTTGSTSINTARGTVGHVGGLSFKKGDVTVRVRNFVIVANDDGTLDASKLTAQVNGKRIDFASIQLTLPPTENTAKKVTVGVTEVKLTAAAAKALSQAFFGIDTAIAEGTLVGSATMKARIVGKGKA